MNKMAIFVEGYTEVVFIDKLIQQIANKNSVLIQWREISGGSTCALQNHQIKAAGPHAGQQHFVVIHDCGGDDAVKTRMNQEYPKLVAAGYSKIICIRDVYPKFTYADIPTLRTTLPMYIKTKPIAVDFILSIMEIEAWFLAEHTHLPKIHPAITVPAIVTALQFNPETDELQLRPTPANDMVACYALGGVTYLKGNAQATMDALDYASIYLELGERFPDLKKLIEIIEAFLGS